MPGKKYKDEKPLSLILVGVLCERSDMEGQAAGFICWPRRRRALEREARKSEQP